jgi:hypothetical protein
MKLRLTYIVFFLLAISVEITGQEKYEKEYRIKAHEVPDSALEFFNWDEFDTKIKWYYEEGLSVNSVEAKFKYGGEKYSVEFDTTGQLEDIEILIDEEFIPVYTRNCINKNLDSLFIRHKTRKIQIQYSGDISSFRSFISENDQEKFTTKYEFIVKGKKNKLWNLYEVTFDHVGKAMKISQIIFRNTDNLEY